MGVVKHSESTQSNKFAISLQHFKREVRDGTYFLHADKHQGFYELTLKFLMEVVMHAQSAQNRKLVIFLQHIEEKVSQLLLCSVVMQNIQIFYGGPVMFVLTLYLENFVKFEDDQLMSIKHILEKEMSKRCHKMERGEE